MSKIFDQNIELWAKERPLEAMRLQMITAKKINIQEDEKEAEEWFKNLPKEQAKVIYVYGIGLGTYYRPLKKWLSEDSDRHVNFLEDDYAALHRFFNTTFATEVLNDKQVSICYFNDVKDSDGVLETLYWSSVLLPFTFSALKSYERDKKEIFEELSYKMAYDFAMKNALVDEYLKCGVSFFRNFYPNMLNLKGAYWGNGLFGKFVGIPAIICGAGPSLEKQIETLGTLKEHALIFAGGSSLNGILAKDVYPHFGAGIDPNPTQLLRLTASAAAKIPFFFRPRIQVDAAKKIQGERLYISGAGGYDIAEYYEKKFGIEAEFLDEGHNVVNFCTEIATRMGCNPIIYVGMDLAYTGMKAYSEGIDNSIQVEESQALHRKDIYGKPILTLWKWIAEADWLERFAKDHPNTELINATEGGIGFPDIPNLPLKKLVKNKLKKAFPLAKKIQEEIQQCVMPQVTSEALTQATLELKESLKKCIAYIDVLLQEVKKEKEDPETNGSLHSGQAALTESDLFEEPAYIHILDIFHQVFARVQNKAVTHLRLNKEALNERAIAHKKLDLQKDKLNFMRHVAEVNIALIDQAITSTS